MKRLALIPLIAVLANAEALSMQSILNIIQNGSNIKPKRIFTAKKQVQVNNIQKVKTQKMRKPKISYKRRNTRIDNIKLYDEGGDFFKIIE